MSGTTREGSTIVDFKIALLRNGLTQVSLAEKLNISTRYLRYILSGQRKAAPLREAIEQLTGCSIAAQSFNGKEPIFNAGR
ncbi:MAG TPA: helix-turn-helix transcriptional regulator [Bryobacteraceae bacterium]|jgi:transcriptional regulator with XRE-family HTH domain|nr:helix-turn-helix transcriptional regulator [Bryobacteraceae bacterium]